jgi:hypothetical protein
LFAFGDYQGRRQDQPLNVEFASVPTAKMRTGDFSELLGLSTPTVPSSAICPNLYSGTTVLPQYDGKGYIYDPTTCEPFGWNGTVGQTLFPIPTRSV